MKVFISGNFNTVHPGHIRLFKKARELGDWVVAGVYSSSIKAELKLFPDADRLEEVSRNSLIDEVVLIKESISKTLELIDPDIILRGKEFETIFDEEHRFALENGKRILFSDGDPFFSESDLFINESRSNIVPKAISNLTTRSREDRNRLTELLDCISNLRVLVIGDILIDEYINCEPLGLSQEDSNVVFKPIDTATFFGGAAIVARHARALGAQVSFLSVCANSDRFSDNLSEQLELDGIQFYGIPEIGRETIIKQRFRVNGSSRFRLTKGTLNSVSKSTENNLVHQAKELSKHSDLVIFSDFNYGAIPFNLPQKLLENHGRNFFVAADSQISSQIGSLAKYGGVDYISATEYEARVAVNFQEEGLAKLITKVRNDFSINNCVIKLGSDGIVFERNETQGCVTGALPAFNKKPVDVAGAGDSFLSASSLVLAAGGNLDDAALIGSIAAAIQVNRIGNVPVSHSDIAKWLIK